MDHEPQRRPLAPRFIALAAVGVVAIGFWGFTIHRPDVPTSEHFYRSLQLFAFESGDLTGTVPWQIETARLLAPALTIASAAIATIILSRNRLDRWRGRRHRGHVVVCGLGDRGTLAALALRRSGQDVVGIEIDPGAAGIARCRHQAIPVVVGDAREPAVLVAAGVPVAAHLVVLTPALGLGGQVALGAADLVDDRTGDALTIHLEVEDPHLAELVRAVELTGHTATGWRLEELNLVGMAAKVALDEQAPWAAGADEAHVLVISDAPLGAAIRAESARRWRRQGGAADRLTVTALGDDVSAGSVVGLVGARPAVSSAYVCLTDETAAIAAALDIVRRLPDVPVFVHLERSEALAELLRRDLPTLRPVSLATRVFTPEALLDSTAERIARALQAAYRHRAPPGDPAAVSWEQLPEGLRASNRAQASHIAAKLRATGRVIVPAGDGPPDEFDENEIERLSQLEHERWVAERTAAGWQPGHRDAAARTTPYLVPWEDLDDDVREVDRRFVRMIPDIVADAGLVLRRIGSTTVHDAHHERGGDHCDA